MVDLLALDDSPRSVRSFQIRISRRSSMPPSTTSCACGATTASPSPTSSTRCRLAGSWAARWPAWIGLLEEKFGVKVNKRLQKADWGARPLSPELLQYAAQDTHYLIPLRDLLERNCGRRDCSNWRRRTSGWRVTITSLGKGIAVSRLPGSASVRGATLRLRNSPSSRNCWNGARLWPPGWIVRLQGPER